MDKLRMCAPTLFGLEGVVGDELKRLGMQEIEVENGRAFFTGSIEDMARANLWLRTAERVLVVLGRFKAETFDALFEGVKKLRWEDYIPRSGKFPIRGHSLDSMLKSIPDWQAIIKKAAADRLCSKYNVSRMPETGEMYQIRFTILKDEATVYLDTSGASLHKRGYRELSNEAPLRETLAAGMVILSRYKGRGEFRDPFCGSGTIPIEAAMIAKNRAPGLMREFLFEKWEWSRGITEKLRLEAKSKEFNGDYRIVGTDIDPEAVKLATANAAKAGMSDICTFEVADVRHMALGSDKGTLIANPPYGMRLLDIREATGLYSALGQKTAELSGWGIYVLTADPEFERAFGRHATKKRKLYNGMIKCDLYMYF
ncbi:MAG: class I SAM-dependent RNA methyltransferase [Bacteroidales bacterium]|nr:class I SAM-dependent RNA methyltransferase [Bacteroidales bacterium]